MRRKRTDLEGLLDEVRDSRQKSSAEPRRPLTHSFPETVYARMDPLDVGEDELCCHMKLGDHFAGGEEQVIATYKLVNVKRLKRRELVQFVDGETVVAEEKS